MMAKSSILFVLVLTLVLLSDSVGAETSMDEGSGAIKYEPTAKDRGKITISLDGGVIFQAAVSVVKGRSGALGKREFERFELRVVKDKLLSETSRRSPDDLRTEPSQAETHVLEFNVLGVEDAGISLKGQIQGGGLLPCIPDAPSGTHSPLRAVSGDSLSSLNTGVYSRQGDWAILFEQSEGLRLKPVSRQGVTQAVTVEASSPLLRIQYKPGFFKRHRGIAWFNPEQYNVRDTVPAGWISWKAYGAGITEEQVKSVADWASEKLVPYGLDSLIIDDGWFGGSDGGMMHNALPGVDWTKANERFPGGVKALADYVHERKMKIGLWLSPFGFSGDTSQHPDWWVRKEKDGDYLRNVWHGEVYADATVPDALNNWLLPGFKAQVANGADYFKVDGQMHVAYEAYAPCNDYFKAKGTTWQEAYRKGWEAIRKTAGERYILSCWSRIPQNVGYADAMRIGGDKDSSWNHVRETAQDLAHWFHEHNILWCADPDHLVWRDLTPAECRTWATLVGLTGTHLTFSDIPEAMTPEKLDILRRILPVVHGPVTRPGELFYREEAPALWTLEVNRPYGNWMIVANTHVGSATVSSIDFAAIGLNPNAEYTVYDYWNHEFKGVHRGSFACGVPAEHDVQVYAIQEKRDYPWVISENRHITQGGVFLHGVKSDRNLLYGESTVTAKEPYVLSIYCKDLEPAQAEASSGTARFEKRGGDIVDLMLESDATAKVEWSLRFKRQRSDKETSALE